MTVDDRVGLTPGELRASLAVWALEHAAQLAELSSVEPTTMAGAIERDGRLMGLLYDAGFLRWGWPIEVGGLGGPVLLRGVVYEELTRLHLPIPEHLLVLETLGPAMVEFAPTLAAEMLPAFQSGKEIWCQGFSEPEAGSDLAALRCTARREGDEYVINGQKTWASFGASSNRVALLARSGDQESRHRGLTMLLVDQDLPGVTSRPIRFAGGRDECAELFFDDVRVPARRLIGEEGKGWSVAMFLLQYERGMYGWTRQAWLHGRLDRLAASLRESGARDVAVERRLGEAYLALVALRSVTRGTLQALSAGDNPGPEISIDKLLLGRAEQLVLDVERELEWPRMELGVGPHVQNLASDWFYSRAATVYGGAAPIQRGILADHLLRLPKEG